MPPFAPEILLTRDRFGLPVPRQPAHSSMYTIYDQQSKYWYLYLRGGCAGDTRHSRKDTNTPARALNREEPGTIYYIYVMVTHIARVWINRVRLPILLVVVAEQGK